MYLFADPDALTSWVGTGTYTVFPDPDPKYSYRYVYGTCTVFRIRIQWMQIEIRLVCSDPNCNKAKILDADSVNPDPKHSYRYVPICGSRQTDELSRYRYLYRFSGSRSEILVQVCTRYGTCTVLRIRIQWMQIEIRLVCPDPNCNKAQMLDPESLNPDPKHFYRYVPICGSRQTDELGRYRYLYRFRILIQNTRTGMYGTCTVFRIRVQYVL